MDGNKTIICENSLLLWEQNRNGQNFNTVNNDSLELILCPAYIDFAQHIYDELRHNKSMNKFIPLWYTENEAFSNQVWEILEKYVIKHNLVTKETEKIWFDKKGIIDSIQIKTQGNIGEIPVCEIATVDGFEWCTRDYKPVDPTKESRFDGTSIHKITKLPFDIQIKNWGKDHKITQDVFDDLEYVINRRIDGRDKRIAKLPEKTSKKLREDYDYTYQHTMLYTYSDIQNDVFKDIYKRHVIVYGPNEINEYYRIMDRSYIWENVLKTMKEYYRIMKKKIK